MSSGTVHQGRRSRLSEFEVAIHHLRDAIFLMTPDGELLFANPAAFSLLGYPEEELLAGGIELVLNFNDLRKLLSTAEDECALPAHYQERMRHKDGRILPVDVELARLSLDGVERLFMVVHDPNQDHRQGFKRPLHALAGEGSPVMVYITDQNWKILWANSDKAIGSGYSIRELLGRPSPLRRYLGEEAPDLLSEIEKELERTGLWTGYLHSRRNNGEVYPAQASVTTLKELLPGQASRLVMLTDVSAMRETEEMIRRMSLYDPITNLANRENFSQEVAKLCGHINPDIQNFYLLVIGIDKFNLINEARGYETGDKVLKQLADRIRNAACDSMLLCRNVGDTFALVANGGSSPTDVAALAVDLLDAVREPLHIEGHQFKLSASIGVSNYPGDGETCDQLLRAATVALQRAKHQGGGRLAYYQRGSEEVSRRYVQLAPLLRDALAEEEFTAAFQPIVDTETWQVVSFEALARWLRPDGTVVSPEDFIPVAEQSNTINSIFETVLRCACQQLRALVNSGFPELTAFVNVSPRQLMIPDFPEILLQVIDDEGISYDRIHLEITESRLMEDPHKNAAVFAALQRRGIRMIIDDFGTGYSSFGYLKHLPVDGIKLDKIFVRDVPGHETSEKLVSMILAMEKALDIPVVAEGVETAAQARFLRRHGCTRLQGFLVSQPLFSEPFYELMHKGIARPFTLEY